MKYMVEDRKTGNDIIFDSLDEAFAYSEQLEKIDHHTKIVKVVLCDCGRDVPCYNFTNTCECGADYNFAGDRLAPREQWGEETGENWQDCY